ncbi:lactonase family protein [Paenibacillus humicola]|uniref:lactonase family protein n=1 Tax=Paenibacillus humicola TaxID=3110540 RepID=UPI00237B89E5|nr:lactonase family protein [Paenibacillus humicola]
MAEKQRVLVFAGSYAEAESKGVYVYEFDETTGNLTLLDEAAGLKNPTFLNVDAQGRKLYAITEGVSADGTKIGEAATFAFDPASGRLSPLGRTATVGAPTCHIQRDADSRVLIVVSYHGGMVGLLSIAEDGQAGELLDVKQHEGRSVHPERQDRPHPHSAFFTPDGRFALVPDLGLDRVFTYAVDKENGRLELRGAAETNPGAGPRHLAFDPAGRFVYVINEVDSTVTSYAFEADGGKLTPIATVSTLPDGYRGENITAEIAVSPDGRYVYGSNRGHDSIAVFAADAATGRLTPVGHVSAEGGHPRNFALTPGGDYLLCANRDTDNIAVFKVDKESGMPTYTGRGASLSKPVCVRPVYVS